MRVVRVANFAKILVTRERGRGLADGLPPESDVTLDFEGVRAASPSFLDQLRRSAEERGARLTFVNVSDQTRKVLDLLERLTTAS